jgi:hypothetical protein
MIGSCESTDLIFKFLLLFFQKLNKFFSFSIQQSPGGNIFNIYRFSCYLFVNIIKKLPEELYVVGRASPIILSLLRPSI